MFSITLISTLILTLSYKPYQRILLDFTGWVSARSRNLALFMFVILFVPVILMVI